MGQAGSASTTSRCEMHGWAEAARYQCTGRGGPGRAEAVATRLWRAEAAVPPRPNGLLDQCWPQHPRLPGPESSPHEAIMRLSAPSGYGYDADDVAVRQEA